jgi:RNA polymerase sigma-70 factor (ECF subfamily)
MDPAVEADLHLMAAVARADPAAQDLLVRRLMGPVKATIRALVARPSEADDAVQIAMLEILRSAAGYRGEATLERWVSRIAARSALHAVRERRTRDTRINPDVDPMQLTAEPVVQPAADALPQPLDAYLSCLSDARRTCLVLRHALGYTVEEIAELTGVSPNTVKDRLLQGRAQVRKMIRRDEATRRGECVP